jgi:SAM-dependent methyltransferase
MRFAMTAWLAPAKVRRRLARSTLTYRTDLISRIARGKSVLDMGGMWSVDGEYAFLAERAGASRVVLCDGMDPTGEFSRKHAASSSRIEYVKGDLHDPSTVERLGAFDVVWCTGVIYHSPDPYRLVEHLRRLTNEVLVLGTRAIPEIPGVEGACIFYPALSESSRRAVGWAHGREAPGMWGAATPFDRAPGMGYANYWWGITPSALIGMLELARFEVLETHQPNTLELDVVAKAVDGESVLPPLEFEREWDDQR